MPQDICSVPIASSARMLSSYKKAGLLVDNISDLQLLHPLQTPIESNGTLDRPPSHSSYSPPVLSHSPAATPISSFRPTPINSLHTLPESEISAIPDAGPSNTTVHSSNSPVLVPRPSTKKRNDGHIPRPPNPFILFACAYRKQFKGQNNRDLSVRAGQRWREMSEIEKAPWRERASIAKKEHETKYPGYQYQPKRNKNKEKQKGKGTKTTARKSGTTSTPSIAIPPVSLPPVPDYSIMHNPPVYNSGRTHYTQAPLSSGSGSTHLQAGRATRMTRSLTTSQLPLMNSQLSSAPVYTSNSARDFHPYPPLLPEMFAAPSSWSYAPAPLEPQWSNYYNLLNHMPFNQLDASSVLVPHESSPGPSSISSAPVSGDVGGSQYFSSGLYGAPVFSDTGHSSTGCLPPNRSVQEALRKSTEESTSGPSGSGRKSV